MNRSVLGVIIGITLVTTFGVTTTMPLLQQRAEAILDPIAKSEPKAPMVASGENLYIVWWTNNQETGARASNAAAGALDSAFLLLWISCHL